MLPKNAFESTNIIFLQRIDFFYFYNDFLGLIFLEMTTLNHSLSANIRLFWNIKLFLKTTYCKVSNGVFGFFSDAKIMI